VEQTDFQIFDFLFQVMPFFRKKCNFVVQLQKEMWPRVFMVERWFTHQIEANKNTKKLWLRDFWIFVSNFFYKPLKKNPGFPKFRNFHKILVIIRRNLGRKSKKAKREFVCNIISFNMIGESTLYHENSGPQLFLKLYHKIVPKSPKRSP